VRILRHVAEVVAGSTFSSCIPALIDAAERDADLRKFHLRFQRDARRPLIEVIKDGVALGSLPPHLDPEFAAYALLGAIFFCRLMTSQPIDPAKVGTLVETVLGDSNQDVR
jgi:TetR/AcrR family transcriptional regulator of autoinduction and epiphytic fitness